MREGKDRGSKWLIEHYADAILHLAGIRGFARWRAVQPQVVQQGRTPDGLVEVAFPRQKEPDYVLLEVYTYPSAAVAEDILRDVALVYLDRGKVPEVVTLLLHPKGRQQVNGSHERGSRLQTAALSCRWRVIEMWNVAAEDLLNAREVGLIPWVPLARYDGPPEALLQQCKERIESLAPRELVTNLLAITQIMAGLRYDFAMIARLLGGSQMFEENSVLKVWWAEREITIAQKHILTVLKARFGDLPEDLTAMVHTVEDKAELESLLPYAAKCPSLKAFRKRLGLK